MSRKRRAGKKTKTTHELAVVLYRKLHGGDSPLWVTDPGEGRVYLEEVAAERQHYEGAIKELRKADDHRQVIVETQTRTVHREPGTGRGDSMG